MPEHIGFQLEKECSKVPDLMVRQQVARQPKNWAVAKFRVIAG